MDTSIAPPESVAIVGGGITGLAAAHRMTQLAPRAQVMLFEAAGRLGGVLHTEHEAGYLLEHSADNFITNIPWGLDLCREIGLGGELLATQESDRRALVLCRGKLQRVPEAFSLLAPGRAWPVVTTPILSWRGKLRLFAERFVPRRDDPESDESLASFARRRLGHETFDRLVQPLVGGIYTADSEQLSLAATLPRFLEMEREHGSLWRATRRQRRRQSADEANSSGARYSLFVAPRRGMSSLVAALAAALPATVVNVGARVAGIEPARGGWQVAVAGETNVRHFDALIVATPAPVSAGLLRDVDPLLADELAAIPYAGTSIALLGYRREQVSHPLDGFGFVVPEVEGRAILAASFSSRKFTERAPAGRVLLRVFVGGAKRPDLVEMDDTRLRSLVERELHELLGVRGEPELFRIVRWPRAMPQYHLRHVDRVRQIEAAAQRWPRLALAGNAYHGVGIPNCIRSGQRAAECVHGSPASP